MKNLSPELLKKYTEIILEVKLQGYPINEENIRKVAREMGNEAVLRQIEQELRTKMNTKDIKSNYNNDFLQKTKTSEKIALQSATAITTKIFLLIGVVVALIFTSIWYFGAIVSIPKRNSIVFYDTFTNAQSTIIWLIYADNDKNTVINLIDGQNKKLLKEINSTIKSPKTHAINNKIYLFDEESGHFETRDSHTGEIILNDESISKQIPQLKSGIGTTKYNSGWLDIVTKQGELFYYHLQTDKLYNETEKENLIEKYEKEKFTKFNWAISQTNTEAKSLMLISKKANFYKETEYTRKNIDRISESDWEKLKRNEMLYNGEKLIFSPKKTFLSGEIIYADSLYCVIRHQTEIGDNAKPIFSCVSAKEKKIVWELQNIDPKQSALLVHLGKDYVSSLLSNRYNNLLTISSQTCQIEGKGDRNRYYPVSCQMDIQTGNILWECTPTF